MSDIYKKIIELENDGINSALCTVVRTKGSTPLKAGAKMLVCEDGKTYGTVGGGSLEKQAIEKAAVIIQSNSEELVTFDLNSDDGNSCGGIAEIFIEPLIKKSDLYIFGAGHVGLALYKMCTPLDFNITVIDDRDKIFGNWPEDGYNKVQMNFNEYLSMLPFNERCFIAIITYDHEIDWEILSYCISKPWHYLGMMGSKKKVKGMSRQLLEMGIPQEKIDLIDMPIGLSINAETASEIAVSIAAGLIQSKGELAKKLKSSD